MRLKKTEETRAYAPHCDQKILHAPGVCDYCDLYPDWQELRQLWGLNFTGENDITKATDPAEVARDLDVINRWPGNTPEGYPPIT